MGGVNDLQAGFHQLATQPSAPQGGVERRTTARPVRVVRVGGIDLAEVGKMS